MIIFQKFPTKKFSIFAIFCCVHDGFMHVNASPPAYPPTASGCADGRWFPRSARAYYDGS